MKYINTYNTDAEYYNDNTKLFPNVSYVKDIDEVKWRRRNPNLFVTKFITNGPNQVIDLTGQPSLFTEIAVEGVPQTLIPNVTVQYTFATPGEHEVTYSFVDTTEIGDYAFNVCDWMTSINIPSTLSITSIGQSAFTGCYHLASFEIPASVTSIGNYAFRGCYGLNSITFPNSVTSIDERAFSGCTGLTSITSLNTTPPTLGANVFANVPSNCSIYVPAASVNAYKAASGWSDRADYIQAIQ